MPYRAAVGLKPDRLLADFAKEKEGESYRETLCQTFQDYQDSLTPDLLVEWCGLVNHEDSMTIKDALTNAIERLRENADQGDLKSNVYLNQARIEGVSIQQQVNNANMLNDSHQMLQFSDKLIQKEWISDEEMLKPTINGRTFAQHLQNNTGVKVDGFDPNQHSSEEISDEEMATSVFFAHQTNNKSNDVMLSKISECNEET